MTTTSPVTPDLDAGGTVDPPAPVRGTMKRLLSWIIPANISIFLLWGAIPTILLPLQVQGIDPDNKAANLALVTTIGALAAMLAQPIAGAISDRTRSRFGRRAPWMVGGVLIGGLALIGMAMADGLVQIAIAWTIVQIAFNFAQGPLSAVLPDRVPRAARGTFSALSGLGLMVGAIGGQVVGASLASDIPRAYMILAGIALIVITLFVVFNPDHSSKHMPTERFSLSDFLHTFWVNPVAHPDFFWAFTGRLLLYTGYFAVTGYQLYILQDFIGLGDDAVAMIPLFGFASLGAILLATLVSGPLSDKLGRRKIFVFISSLLVAVAMIIPILMPSFGGWMIFTVIAGLGFGCFQAVDTALMSEVLPSAKSFAKDLGVVNIAATLPQTLAPAVAGAIVVAAGGAYLPLFPIGIVLSILGAFAVWAIKSVR